MQEKFGDQGLRIVAVNAWDEPSKTVKEFVEENSLPYTVLLNGEEIHTKVYRGQRIPHTYFLDRRGKIVYTQLGWEEGDQEKFERRITKMLEKNPSARSY